jgi:uncharacterized protein YutE (UPF0331/DUF86 family)
MDIYSRKFDMIGELLEKLSELRKENPTLDRYRNSWKDKDSAERNLQKIVEAIIDIGKMQPAAPLLSAGGKETGNLYP